MDWMWEVRAREKSKMTRKFLVCVTGWMVAPLTEMDKTGIGTGLRGDIRSSVLAMLCFTYFAMSKMLYRQLESGGECKARNLRLGAMGSRDSRTNDPGERG